MTDHPRATVSIPGSFAATYDSGTGKIVRLEFSPAILVRGGQVVGPVHGASPPEVEGWSMPEGPIPSDGLDLDVRSDSGPFWTAMREALVPVRGAGREVFPHAIPIEWAE